MILDRYRLDGQVALVTGAGKGIGRGIAHGFAQAGASVVVTARTESDLRSLVSEIEPTGGRALAVVGDVTDAADRVRIVERAVESFGRLDILVNNAGGSGPRPVMQTSERFLEAAFRFNAIAPIMLTQLAAQAMMDTAGQGSVLNVSSRSADMVLTSFAAYGAAKAALNQFTRVAAAEMAPHVRVNAISVGGVATQALAMVLNDDDMRANYERNTPLGRAGQPEDIASCALFLCSPAASWITGKILQVDGGVERPAMDVPAPPLVARS